MEKKLIWTKILFVLGIIALVVGSLDPMEGSVVIAAGSILISVATYYNRGRFWKLFLLSTVLIIIGVFFVFFLSSLGGVGGNSKLSIWWIVLMIPYPVGWLLTVVLLIVRAVEKRATKPVS